MCSPAALLKRTLRALPSNKGRSPSPAPFPLTCRRGCCCCCCCVRDLVFLAGAVAARLRGGGGRGLGRDPTYQSSGPRSLPSRTTMLEAVSPGVVDTACIVSSIACFPPFFPTLPFSGDEKPPSASCTFRRGLLRVLRGGSGRSSPPFVSSRVNWDEAVSRRVVCSRPERRLAGALRFTSRTASPAADPELARFPKWRDALTVRLAGPSGTRPKIFVVPDSLPTPSKRGRETIF